MYVRVKRQKLTVFLQVEPTDTLGQLKERLAVLVDQVRRTFCVSMRRRRGRDAAVERPAASISRAERRPKQKHTPLARSSSTLPPSPTT